ncbi:MULTISPECIES: AAA family ATPase [Protofrankia]|uniref:Nuclease SbcCD subunit C n=1 Tax=Candidatus Protofrankia datiscae TaxID=2716812 RepID=F8B3Q2_9ACTN|nr:MULTISPECIES: AAA family ATPase [Protofrankia]AEH08997.1 hypothetical protein FsymDg_1537 [Candidatus Protofrankia datiscae]
MRPHRLELAAFGAFPDKIELDFDRLGAGSLVLLCGETGGGKTTLLDALGFALYGVVPGLRARAKDLRSHHAGADAQPRVQLEFSVSGQRYQITRTAAWDRPRRGGGGSSRVNPTALLRHRTDTGWESVAQRNEDVGLEIGRLLGMTAEQFFQVIMLPQGRFADFLQADHDARERLLKRLFAVSRFEHAEQWLADQAKIAGERLAAARGDLARVATRAAEAAAATEPNDLETDADWVAGLAAAADAAARTATQHAGAAAEARRQAEESLDLTRGLAERQQQRRELDARLATLEAQLSAIEVMAAELAAARRAATVRRALDQVRERADDLTRARLAEDAGRHRLELLGARHDVDVDELARLARVAHTDMGRLEQFANILTAADADDAAATAADIDADTHAAAVATLTGYLRAELPEQRRTLEARHSRARAAATALPGAREQARTAAELAAAVRRRGQALTHAHDAEQSARLAREQAGDIRQQRFDAITAELSAALVDGSPCPVCGSLTHPDPAEARADHISKDDELAAEAIANRLATQATDARRDADRLDERIRTLTRALANQVEPATAVPGPAGPAAPGQTAPAADLGPAGDRTGAIGTAGTVGTVGTVGVSTTANTPPTAPAPANPAPANPANNTVSANATTAGATTADTPVVDVTAVGPAGGTRVESVAPRGPLPSEDVGSGPPRPVRAFATVTVLGVPDPVPGGNDGKTDHRNDRGNAVDHETTGRENTGRAAAGHADRRTADPRATGHSAAQHGPAQHGPTDRGSDRQVEHTDHQADHHADHKVAGHGAADGVTRLEGLPAGPELPTVLPVDAFEQAAVGLADRAETLAAQADDLPAAERALERVRQEETRAAADLAGHAAGEQLARTRAQECRARAERQRASLPPELRDVGRLAARQREVAQFADAYSDCHAAASTTALAEEEYRRAAAGASHDAHAAGFPDVAAAQAACREEGWIVDTEARLTAHRDDLVGVRSHLASPQLAVDPDRPAPVAEREADALAARQRHEAALTEAARADDRARRLSDLVPAFAAAFAAVPPLREAAEELRGLAELATGRGGNRHGMPLSSFVLAARLEEVATAASGRLSAMSGGRFTLVHDSGERRDRRRRAGLGLLVEDAWTGRRRDTATLSGGETFQAALSLALGLADVVTAESGGQAMDALFIDEGFGSLDPDSLEEVMNVLDSLRSGGRLVGIVSHVADLRQRIPTQITVIKQANGSHVRTTV